MKTWKDIPGWFDFQDLYDGAVNRAPQKGAVFVEIGALFGRSTVYMAQKIAHSRKNIAFVVVDTWDESFFALGEDRAKMKQYADANGGFFKSYQKAIYECGVEHIVQTLQCDQIPAAKFISNKSVDFVFLDTDHGEESTRATIKTWLPKLKPNGVFAGHDYSPRWPGVVTAVNEAFKTKGLAIIGTSWLWRNS